MAAWSKGSPGEAAHTHRSENRRQDPGPDPPSLPVGVAAPLGIRRVGTGRYPGLSSAGPLRANRGTCSSYHRCSCAGYRQGAGLRSRQRRLLTASGLPESLPGSSARKEVTVGLWRSPSGRFRAAQTILGSR